MNCRYHRTFFNQFIPVLITIFLVLASVTGVNGQANHTGYNDVARQRLLIRIIGQYLHTISQGQIDMDSAIRIPCKLYGLSPLLVYNEGYSDGKPSMGTHLLDAGQINAAKALLNDLQGEARLRLLIELGSYYVFRPGNVNPDLKEAAKYIDEALRSSKGRSAKWQIEGLSLKAHLLAQSGLLDDSQLAITEALQLAGRSANKTVTARTLLNAGELLFYGNPSRLSYFEKALTIFQSQKLKEKEIEVLSLINIEYFVTKHYNVAEKILLRVLQLQKAIGFRQQQYPYDGLAFMANRTGKLTNALAYSNKSLECLATKNDSVFKSFFFARRAMLYEHLRDFPESMTWYNKALENRSAKTRLFWYKSFFGKVASLNHIDKPKEALSLLNCITRQFPPISIFEKMHVAFLYGISYDNLKQFDLAEKNYKVFLSSSRNFPVEYVHDEFPSALFRISTFYRETGNTVQARKLLELGKKHTSELDFERKDDYYYYLFKIDSTEKRYINAIRNMQLSHQFADSAFSYDQRKKVDELLVKYEADKKDKNIKLLGSQNQLAQIRAKEADKTKNITLAGLVLLLVIAGLLFNRYLIKQKTNRKLEASQKELDQKNVFLEELNAGQEKLLKEKEWLIREVHHRVKNNLQMVTSLLSSQSAYLHDEAARIAVKDSLRRMQAMSMIHQKLYQEENISTISMPEYIYELADYLHDSFDTDNRIVFRQNIDQLELDVVQAIPLGLIITESIVNAIKHGFLNDQPGIVKIDLHREGTDDLTLKISDNGGGLPEGIDKFRPNSLGLDLMQGLTRQLNGTFVIENNNGVHIIIRFKILNK